jgi:superfamily II DNA/RNA helicase
VGRTGGDVECFAVVFAVQHYIHRVGRTARAGRSGRAISMVGEKEWKLLKDIVKKANNPVKSRTVPARKYYSAKLNVRSLVLRSMNILFPLNMSLLTPMHT